MTDDGNDKIDLTLKEVEIILANRSDGLANTVEAMMLEIKKTGIPGAETQERFLDMAERAWKLEAERQGISFEDFKKFMMTPGKKQ